MAHAGPRISVKEKRAEIRIYVLGLMLLGEKLYFKTMFLRLPQETKLVPSCTIATGAQ